MLETCDNTIQDSFIKFNGFVVYENIYVRHLWLYL